MSQSSSSVILNLKCAVRELVVRMPKLFSSPPTPTPGAFKNGTALVSVQHG